MAERTKKTGKPSTLGEQLKNSKAAETLKQEAASYLQARASGVVDNLVSKMDSATDKLESSAAGGEALGKAGLTGAKKLAEGKSPVAAALGAAGTGVKEKVKSLFGKGGGKGAKTATNIIEDIDIGQPISVTYDQWTQYQEFASFMKGVEGVDQKDEVESTWRLKVFKSRRAHSATVTEQIPDRRICWTTTSAKGSTKGVISFHPLADDLTKVLVVLEYYPAGFMEKTGNIWRAAGRRARLDLKLFRKFVSMRDEQTGSWRGEIRDSQVVRQPEDEQADDQDLADEPAEDQDETTDQDESAESAEDEDQEDAAEVDEQDEAEPEKPAPKRTRRSTSRSRSTSKARSAS